MFVFVRFGWLGTFLLGTVYSPTLFVNKMCLNDVIEMTE